MIDVIRNIVSQSYAFRSE